MREKKRSAGTDGILEIQIDFFRISESVSASFHSEVCWNPVPGAGEPVEGNAIGLPRREARIAGSRARSHWKIQRLRRNDGAGCKGRSLVPGGRGYGSCFGFQSLTPYFARILSSSPLARSSRVPSENIAA